MSTRLTLVCCLLACTAGSALAQDRPSASETGTATRSVTGVELPSDYVIGVEDILSITFWRDEQLSTEAVVRPDGRISLLLLNEIPAAGLTPEQLRTNIQAAAAAYLTDPTVGVTVKAINSRKVFITGEIGNDGFYPLIRPTTVMELISMAGGVNEYADKDDIRIARIENGMSVSFKFNYKDFLKGKKLETNILLKPGDIVTVP